MATYTYKAADQDGAIVEGKYLSSDREGVIKHLEQMDLIPISVSDTVVMSGGLGQDINLGFLESISAVDRITIARNLAAATKSGLDILQAIDILIMDASKKKIRSLLSGVKANMQNGQSLSDAFEQQKGIFPKVTIGMLRAGEASGRLGFTLDEISTNMAKDYGMARKLQSAFAYPTILLVASGGVVALLLGFVLPRLQNLFSVSHVKLPLITRVLIAVSDAFRWSPLLDVTIVGLIVAAVIAIRKSEPARAACTRFVFRLPLVRDVMKKIALVRFTRTLGYMIGSGTMITDALMLTSEAVGNPVYRDAIVEASKELQIGVSFSHTFEKYPDLFPRFLVSLVSVGEKTGTLETVLKTFANFYEEEVDAALKDLTNVIEPILLVVMGVIVGSVVMSVLLPIYQLVGSYT